MAEQIHWRARSEVLRSLMHYQRAQSQKHHTIDRPEERGVEKELDALPAGTKPKASHHRSPGGERREKRKSLMHYQRAQSQKRHTIDRPEERGVERESARRSSLKGRERAIVNQTNVVATSERRGAAHMGFSERIYTILNRTGPSIL